MAVIARIAIVMYLLQAAAGFVAGLTVPWLLFLTAGTSYNQNEVAAT